MAELQKLEVLDLTNTQITDTGLKDVAKMQQLTHLSLRGTKATKAGAAELKRALPNSSISGP